MNTSAVKEAIRNFLEIQKQLRPEELVLKQFSIDEYRKVFGDRPDTWYRHFDIVDDECIRICYGYDDKGTEVTDSFIVKL